MIRILASSYTNKKLVTTLFFHLNSIKEKLLNFNFLAVNGPVTHVCAHVINSMLQKWTKKVKEKKISQQRSGSLTEVKAS